MSDSIIVIPTYKESENIARIIAAIFALPQNFHILVIDDNSPDGTAAIVKQLIAEKYADSLFIEERKGKLGLGTAYIHGFRWALERHYEYIFDVEICIGLCAVHHLVARKRYYGGLCMLSP